MAARNPNISNRQLRAIIDATFNDEDFRSLCFDLGISYEDLKGTGKKEKVAEIVRYCSRHKRIQDLIDYLLQARPNYLDQFTTNQSDLVEKYHLGQEEALHKLQYLQKKHGIGSREYEYAYSKFLIMWGHPGRKIPPPGAYTDGGSHHTDNDHFGKSMRGGEGTEADA
ncbi:MAG TPA: hypothetical protein PLD25_10420 [Chloroflexota bacterium]|nr:hypothetical protein [Chloroflexota bacterium]HUM69148.1 hypothetical protein [Chloroflexota bacterium]